MSNGRRDVELVLLAIIGTLIGLSLGAVGAGGSILAVPALVYIADQPAKVATTSSLAVVLLTALIASRPHWRLGNVRFDIAVPFGLVGLVGSLAGKALGERLDADALMLAFSFVMVVAATMMARRTRSCACPAAPAPPTVTTAPAADSSTVTRTTTAPPPVATTPRPSLARIGALGVGVGLMTGFFGVGGGFVIVPALVLALGLSMPHAVGTSLVIIAINSASAFALKAPGVELDWGIIVVFAAAAGVGALFGERASRRVSEATLTRTFVGVVYGVAVYTAARSLGALLG